MAYMIKYEVNTAVNSVTFICRVIGSGVRDIVKTQI